MTPDQINGVFEGAAALFVIRNIRVLYKDKQVCGVSILSTGFFTSWGFWNLFYYPNLNQYWSLYGGILIVITNIIWVGQMIFYTYFKGVDHGRKTDCIKN
jgi:hypothetical protein